eukprot:116998-Amphidinium_carterae.1
MSRWLLVAWSHLESPLAHSTKPRLPKFQRDRQECAKQSGKGTIPPFSITGRSKIFLKYFMQ